ncbi:MAG: hypothetical protein HYR67_11380 [Bacteroidetes bacterium]|nr:hypothetical protein [Bacteroidota bacterium]
MRLKLLFLVLISCNLKIGIAQSTSTLMGARAMGMGFTSSAIADEWSLFNNVGGLGKINQASANFAYEIRPALTGANRMAASILTPIKIGTLGLGVFRFGDDVYSEQLVSAGFGSSIGNTSLGAKVNYIQYRAESFGTNTATSFDFGGITQITTQIAVGAYIANLTQSKLIGTDGERLPTKLVAGLGFRPSEKILIATEIEKDLDYQTTWRSGLEYAIYKKVFFRTGFNMNPNAAYFGLGAQKRNLKIDYALKFNQLTGTAHQASAIYLFSSKQKK